MLEHNVSELFKYMMFGVLIVFFFGVYQLVEQTGTAQAFQQDVNDTVQRYGGFTADARAKLASDSTKDYHGQYSINYEATNDANSGLIDPDTNKQIDFSTQDDPLDYGTSIKYVINAEYKIPVISNLAKSFGTSNGKSVWNQVSSFTTQRTGVSSSQTRHTISALASLQNIPNNTLMSEPQHTTTVPPLVSQANGGPYADNTSSVLNFVQKYFPSSVFSGSNTWYLDSTANSGGGNTSLPGNIIQLYDDKSASDPVDLWLRYLDTSVNYTIAFTFTAYPNGYPNFSSGYQTAKMGDVMVIVHWTGTKLKQYIQDYRTATGISERGTNTTGQTDSQNMPDLKLWSASNQFGASAIMGQSTKNSYEFGNTLTDSSYELASVTSGDAIALFANYSYSAYGGYSTPATLLDFYNRFEQQNQ